MNVIEYSIPGQRRLQSVTKPNRQCPSKPPIAMMMTMIGKPFRIEDAMVTVGELTTNECSRYAQTLSLSRSNFR